MSDDHNGRSTDAAREAEKAIWVTRSSTEDGGEPLDGVDEEMDAPYEARQNDLASDVLKSAQGIGRPVRAPRRKRRRLEPGESAYSGPGPDERDPQRVGRVLDGLLAERGWRRPVTEARIFADWTGVVGEDIARHCEPVSLREGELRISAESTAWATQLRMMAGTLLARLADELGAGVVKRVAITGPTGPTWKHGGWSVRGARGPRDTYG